MGAPILFRLPGDRYAGLGPGGRLVPLSKSKARRLAARHAVAIQDVGEAARPETGAADDSEE